MARAMILTAAVWTARMAALNDGGGVDGEDGCGVDGENDGVEWP